MSYTSLLSFGDFISLKFKCDVKKLFDEIKQFSFSQYNPRKDIKRYGLSITSLDGSINGIDLDSIKDYNIENKTEYDELSFNKLTDVYYSSNEIQKVVKPFIKHLGRSHILYLPEGGYFPPHRDLPVYYEGQNSLRVLIPLKGCNPPDLYFMYENKPLYFEHGRAYFLNTNKAHNLFSFKDSYMIVLNIKTSEEVYKIIGDNFKPS
mgnify:CR=1 FL=1|jgi:hypothetical protein|tara:strand:+ start:268 stop:885 length:618 start_codon:yes stop_codon:yes gene_type:complete